MPYIVSYQKHTTASNTFYLRLHVQGSPDAIGQEIATVGGVTYVAVRDDATLPAEQPAEIAASIVNPVTLTDDLRGAIKAVSPQVRVINARVVEKIRARYSADDEIKCLRLAPSAETQAWNDWTEACRAWGHEQKAALGL